MKNQGLKIPTLIGTWLASPGARRSAEYKQGCDL
jgi:hypothetical protein